MKYSYSIMPLVIGFVMVSVSVVAMIKELAETNAARDHLRQLNDQQMQIIHQYERYTDERDKIIATYEKMMNECEGPIT